MINQLKTLWKSLVCYLSFFPVSFDILSLSSIFINFITISSNNRCHNQEDSVKHCCPKEKYRKIQTKSCPQTHKQNEMNLYLKSSLLIILIIGTKPIITANIIKTDLIKFGINKATVKDAPNKSTGIATDIIIIIL